eukprot:GHVR01114170.1.p1 GENE.GHVR01114170.1~~GHVR01114170.1.p1  ORF type:complete len:208 (+),score=39.30 GHVR01114170.1:98-721(+)
MSMESIDEETNRSFGGGGDVTVQATTDDAAISKLSAVTMGYYKDDFIQHFVRKPVRRSPLINRGYYARVAGMRKVIQTFADAFKNEEIQFVSIGSGMDTTFFHVNEMLSGRIFQFFEVDFTEISLRKTSTILRKEMCWKVLANEKADIPLEKGLIRHETLKLVGADIRRIEDLDIQIRSAGLKTNVPTLFISECVLVYLPGKSGDAV